MCGLSLPFFFFFFQIGSRFGQFCFNLRLDIMQKQIGFCYFILLACYFTLITGNSHKRLKFLFNLLFFVVVVVFFEGFLNVFLLLLLLLLFFLFLRKCAPSSSFHVILYDNQRRNKAALVRTGFKCPRCNPKKSIASECYNCTFCMAGTYSNEETCVPCPAGNYHLSAIKKTNDCN